MRLSFSARNGGFDIDGAGLRKMMVATQLRPRGISDERLLSAMSKVPREAFVPDALQKYAYDDGALRIGEGQTISQPYMVAVMTELLGLRGHEKVLEIGTGSGYQCAILAELAKEVCTIERFATLLESAKSKLDGLGYANIKYMSGDGTCGWAEESPFDAIIVTAGAPDVPSPLLEQLNLGGVIVIPVGSRFSQILIRAVKTKEGFEKTYHTPCVFVPLVGDFGWRDEELF